MSDRPETLEETQARLAQHKPKNSRPLPPVPSGAPSAPAPSAPALPPVPPPASAPAEPLSPGRDPYTNQYDPTDDAPASPLTKRSPRRPLPFVIAGIALVLAIAVGGAVWGFSSASSSALWHDYPGTAYRDADEALNGDSLEVVMERGTTGLADFQQALTDEFGMEWETVYDETLDHDYNYYGGESMLYFWDTGWIQGTATVSDPGARQAIVDAFVAATTEGDPDSFSLWNDLLPEGDEFVLEQYGLGGKQQQAHWSGNTRDDSSGLVFSLDIFDRSVPVGDTFTGDDSFFIGEGDTSTLFVTVFASAPGLLSEADRAEFIERLKPYEGLTKPDPTG